MTVVYFQFQCTVQKVFNDSNLIVRTSHLTIWTWILPPMPTVVAPCIVRNLYVSALIYILVRPNLGHSSCAALILWPHCHFLTSTSILMSLSFSCNSARMPSSTTLSIVILRVIILSTSMDPLPSASMTRSKSVVV